MCSKFRIINNFALVFLNDSKTPMLQWYSPVDKERKNYLIIKQKHCVSGISET